MDNSSKRLGGRLRLVRRRRKLTLKSVADKLSVPPRTYENYESGRNIPPLSVIRAFSDSYSIRLDWLIKGEGHPDILETPEHLRRLYVMLEKQLKTSDVDLRAENRVDVFLGLYGSLQIGVLPSEGDVDALIRAAAPQD